MADAQRTLTQADPRDRRLTQTFEWMSKLWKSQPPLDRGVKMSTQMHYGEQTKHVIWSFDERKFDCLELIQITDLQHGHVACKYNREIEYRDWVLEKPNRYMFWTGDNIDAYALGKSPGSPWEETGDSQSQANHFAEVWGPARHRILGYVGGNHERRGFGSFGDLGTYIANLLQIPYSAGQQFVDVRFGKWAPFKVHLWHGRGAARTKGAKMNMIYNDLMKKSDADLCLCGHLHDVLSTFRWIQERDAKGNIAFRKQGGAMSSSFLEFFGTYAEVAGMDPSDVMQACATVFPNKHWRLAFQ